MFLIDGCDWWLDLMRRKTNSQKSIGERLMVSTAITVSTDRA